MAIHTPSPATRPDNVATPSVTANAESGTASVAHRSSLVGTVPLILTARGVVVTLHLQESRPSFGTARRMRGGWTHGVCRPGRPWIGRTQARRVCTHGITSAPPDLPVTVGSPCDRLQPEPYSRASATPVSDAKIRRRSVGVSPPHTPCRSLDASANRDNRLGRHSFGTRPSPRRPPLSVRVEGRGTVASTGGVDAPRLLRLHRFIVRCARHRRHARSRGLACHRPKRGQLSSERKRSTWAATSSGCCWWGPWPAFG